MAPRGNRGALWCCLGAGFATLIDGTMMAFVIPSLSASLSPSVAQVQWILAAYSLTFGLGLVPAGRIGDAFGRARMFQSGLGLFLLGAVLSACAPSAGLVVCGRLIQGLGAGFISAQVLGLIQDLYRGAERLRALAAYTVAAGAAALAGPVLAGLAILMLPDDIVWRAILLTPCPFICAVLVMTFRKLSPSAAIERRVALDLPGIAMLGALVLLITVPVIDPGLPIEHLIAIGVVVIGLLVAIPLWERRYSRSGRLALFAPELMRSRGYVIGNVIALLWFGVGVSLTTVITIYFLSQTSMSPLLIALALLPSAMARIVAARRSGRRVLADGAAATRTGLGLQAVAVLLVLVASFTFRGLEFFIAVAVLQIVLGYSGGIVEPQIRSLTLAFAPSRMHGVAASFLQLTQRLSGTFFVALLTGILLGGGLSVHSLRWVLAVCIVVSLIASLCAASKSVSVSPAASDPTPAPATGTT